MSHPSTTEPCERLSLREAHGRRRPREPPPTSSPPVAPPKATALSAVPALARPSSAVAVRGLTKVHPGGVAALCDVDLEVPRGGFTCLVGASGCGKSSLLDLLAGVATPTSGEVTVEGRSTLLFQEAALFPWLTASRNVELALRLRGVPRRERREQARELLELVHLAEAADEPPHALSGGMRQRVALARALAQDADVLLMDEPFAALDAITRDRLHDELESIWERTGVTVVFVTHNVREAVRLGRQVVVLSSRPGRVAATFDIDLDRPRAISDPDVAALSTRITATLRDQATLRAVAP
jgi:NitT/TauT family transport system ATP-binding protein